MKRIVNISDLICNFCLEKEVETLYELPDIEIRGKTATGKNKTYAYKREWIACKICRELISEGKEEDLVNRSFRKIIESEYYKEIKEQEKIISGMYGLPSKSESEFKSDLEAVYQRIFLVIQNLPEDVIETKLR